MINDVYVTKNFEAEIVIATRNGEELVFLDNEDVPFAQEINRLVLYKDPSGRKLARADKTDNQVLLHRHLFEIPKGSRLEWINGNTLDLRRENLQLVDRQGNVTPLAQPKEAAPIREVVPATSGDPAKSEVGLAAEPKRMKGVVRHKHSGKWTSRQYVDKHTRHSLGYFDTEAEAVAETLLYQKEGPDSPKLQRNQRKGN